jgi:hypothetical protein
VFPNSHDKPTSRVESGIDPSIASDVEGKLFPPVASVGARVRSVLRAAVPIAPVDKDGNSLSDEDNVRANTNVSSANLATATEAKALVMERGAQRYFGPSVAPSVTAHYR